MSNETALKDKHSSSKSNSQRTARVVSVRESLVTIETGGMAIKKNEVGHICVGTERLMAEVLRIQGDTADMQVFEDTRGVRVGDPVEMSGNMLSVYLGPGLLGQDDVLRGHQRPGSLRHRPEPG